MDLLKTEVTDFLEEQRVSYRVKYHSKPVFTSEEAAVERGVLLSQVVKTMLLADGDDVLGAVIPSHKRLDVKKLKKISGHKNLQFMEKGTIERKTGLIVGAVAPIGRTLKGVSLFVDPSVFDEEWLDISSGDPKAGLELHRDDLKKLLMEATFVAIAKEQP
jgi:Cys-tRNA(Pro)/Cys-tRNA(Cys) deacylase